MRTEFCDAVLSRSTNRSMLFLTGDLGFMALEPLQAAMGDRFINAGVAEQNMISVAAGLAREAFEVWVYSIAPFCYARPFEQIRNDIAYHALPVKLVGNGGGYGYGVMGPTHHAIEDYGVLLTLTGFQVFVPVFDEDVEAAVRLAGDERRPSYLRLGRGEKPTGYVVPPYAKWRQLVRGESAVVIAVGPLAGSYLEALQALPVDRRPSLWVVAELPITLDTLPPELLRQVAQTRCLCVAEEHVARGGVGAELALLFATESIRVPVFRHLSAQTHRFERYGSQAYLRRQSGLDVEALLSAIAAPAP